MDITPEIRQEIRNVLSRLIGLGYNLTVHPLDHSAVMHSQDADALLEAICLDTFNIVQVNQSTVLVGTFVIDVENVIEGNGSLVSSMTRSIQLLFKDIK